MVDEVAGEGLVAEELEAWLGGGQRSHLVGRWLQWLALLWGRLERPHSRYGCLRGSQYEMEIVLSVF